MKMHDFPGEGKEKVGGRREEREGRVEPWRWSKETLYFYFIVIFIVF
jgi:hypothetical protein